MKKLTGYLRDRATGVGVSGKAVTWKNLAGADITSAVTYWQDVDAVTDADGRFEAKFELSPGPVNVTVTVSGSEVKKRMHDEQVQYGPVWSSDIGRIIAAREEGVIDNFLNELALSIPAGHTIRIATGGAIFNHGIYTIENGPLDITGTANPSGPNPRIDLVTLRQYDEDASGQNAGRQTYVVTEGSSAGVAPSTPTGADFVDLPLGTVSTAQGAATKTLHSDLRVFTPASAPSTEPKHSRTVANSVFNSTTSLATWITAVISGLDASRIYDGELILHGTVDVETATAVAALMVSVSHANLLDGGFASTKDGDSIAVVYPGTYDEFDWQVFEWTWPIIGLTGVTSMTIPVQLKRGTGDSQIRVYDGGYALIRLRPRP